MNQIHNVDQGDQIAKQLLDSYTISMENILSLLNQMTEPEDDMNKKLFQLVFTAIDTIINLLKEQERRRMDFQLDAKQQLPNFNEAFKIQQAKMQKVESDLEGFAVDIAQIYKENQDEANEEEEQSESRQANEENPQNQIIPEPSNNIIDTISKIKQLNPTQLQDQFNEQKNRYQKKIPITVLEGHINYNYLYHLANAIKINIIVFNLIQENIQKYC